MFLTGRRLSRLDHRCGLRRSRSGVRCLGLCIRNVCLHRLLRWERDRYDAHSQGSLAGHDGSVPLIWEHRARRLTN